MTNSLVQQKFGAAAADYAASLVHAAGPSLAWLVGAIETKPTWRVLDIATGAGHTALAFAPKVAKVTASDITPEMLAETRRLAKERRLSNVVATRASADDLPFPDTSYNLVTCRWVSHQAGDAHHQRNARSLLEKRVLAPEVMFAQLETVVAQDNDNRVVL